MFFIYICKRTKCQEKNSWESIATRRGAINNGSPHHFFACILPTVLVEKKQPKNIYKLNIQKKIKFKNITHNENVRGRTSIHKIPKEGTHAQLKR